MAKHVGVSLQFETNTPASCPLDHQGNASGRERRAAFVDEYEGRRRLSRCRCRSARSSSPSSGCVLGVSEETSKM
jgi:hypothetical protein